MIHSISNEHRQNVFFLMSMTIIGDLLIIRSSASSPEPDNNNQDFAPSKTKGLDPRFLPDPGCPVDLR